MKVEFKVPNCHFQALKMEHTTKRVKYLTMIAALQKAVGKSKCGVCGSSRGGCRKSCDACSKRTCKKRSEECMECGTTFCEVCSEKGYLEMSRCTQCCEIMDDRVCRDCQSDIYETDCGERLCDEWNDSHYDMCRWVMRGGYQYTGTSNDQIE